MSRLHKINGCENPDRRMDIVFVHGLGGDAFETWRHGSDDSTSWPHWVGAEFSDVGVWSLGYAASPSKALRIFTWFKRGSRDAGYAMSLQQRARQVADLMIQKGLGRRPLIFVGHSLGGLLTKQLLRYSFEADDNGSLRTVVNATRAVLFLGTPHNGAVLATLLDRFREVFGTTVAIEALRAHDPHLMDLYDWYRNNATRLGITTATYYEDRGVAGGTLTIVNSTSSHPGVGRDPIALDENHLTLARPRERDAQVCDALRELIAGVTRGQPSSAASPAPLTTAPLPVIAHLAAPVSASAPPSRIVWEKPPKAAHYFGRDAERDLLTQRLRDGRNTAVVGPAGFGKTALAAEALSAIGDAALRDIYPDGSIYLDLYATHAHRDAIWSQLANWVAEPGFLEKATPQIRAQEACRSKRLLLILEGGEEADGRDGRAELAELLSVVPAGAVRLLLTREIKQALPAESIPLRAALEPDNATALLEVLSGDRLVEDDRRRLLALLAGHPLAITWAGHLLARDDEHPEALLSDWISADLPQLTDPLDNTHTLRWLYDRSTRGLDVDAKQILSGAGLLAHSPISLALFGSMLEGADQTVRSRAALRVLVGAGLMRIEVGLPDHWQFAHVLAYRYARDQAASADTLAQTLAECLGTTLTADCAHADEPRARVRVAGSLDHAAVLLRAAPLTDEVQWRHIVAPLLYDCFTLLIARGCSDLSRYALDIVDAWMDGRDAADSERSNLLREYGVLQSHRGDLLILQGNLPGALARYEAGLAIRQRLAEVDRGNAGWQRDLSVSFERLGDVQAAQGDLSSARTHYEAGLAIRQRLAEADPGNARWQRDLSVSFNKLGDVQSARGDLPSARARYEEGLTIAQRLAEADSGNAGWERDLRVSFERLGDVGSAQGDLPGARMRYEAGLAVAQRLAEADPGNAEWQRDLGVSFEKLGDVQSAQGDLPGAQTRYEAGLAIRQRLAEADPGNTRWQRDLSVSFNKLGDVQLAQDNLPVAQARYEAGLEIAQRLAESDPGNVEWQRDLSVCLDNLGDVESSRGDLPGARAHYEAGLAIAQRLAESDPGNAGWQRDLSVSFKKLGDVQSARGDLPGARARYEEGLAIAQRLAESDPSNAGWQRDLSISFRKLGNVKSAQGDLPGAQACYEAGLAIQQRLAEADTGSGSEI